LYSAALPKTKFYVVNASGGLADVVVSLKGITGKSAGANAEPVVLDQKGCLYSPTILAVQTGQKVIVKNSDPCAHNVHTKPTANTEANQVQMAGGPDLTFTFDKPEPFLKFQCDVHPWMNAYIGVIEHPFFSVTGDDGSFQIGGLPPGSFLVEAWHEVYGVRSQLVTVTDQETKEVGFTFGKN